jgi:hypothetical protein
MGRGRIEPHRRLDMRTATLATGPARRSPVSSVATTRAALFTVRAPGFAHRPGVPDAQVNRELQCYILNAPLTILPRHQSPLELSPTSTHNREPADVTIQQPLPTNHGFIRSALSEGLSSNRHSRRLEFAVTHRKQTTDTGSKWSLFSP